MFDLMYLRRTTIHDGRDKIQIYDLSDQTRLRLWARSEFPLPKRTMELRERERPVRNLSHLMRFRIGHATFYLN